MSNELSKPRSDLKSLINSEAVKAQIARCLPQHLTADRFLRVATTALLKVPKLADCDQASFMQAMLDCSSLGLEPDGRRCHLIPYGKTCQLIIDYKGLIELAKRSGEVAAWQPFTVCERDSFSWKNGVVTHEVDFLSDRGKTLAYYSQVKLKSGEIDYEVMTLAEVEAIRKRSKAANSGPWVTDFDEMAKKTVMRRHSKRLTLSPEFHDALEKDADTLAERQAGRVVAASDNLFLPPANGAQGEPATPENNVGLEPVHATAAEETFTLEQEAVSVFPQSSPPAEQLEWLLENNRMSESELFAILHGAGMVKPEIDSLAQLSDKQAAGIVKSWDLVMSERKGGEA